MSRDTWAYRDVAVHTVSEQGRIVVRPMPGQAFAPMLRVHCAAALRTAYPVGTAFLLSAKMTDRQGGEPYLYAWQGDAVRVLSPSEAKRFLAEFKRGRI